MVARDEFVAFQQGHFEEVETRRFAWQTGNPYVQRKERELLEALARRGQNCLVLEVGCGEGANLVNLNGHFERVVGVDFSWPRIGFCQRALEDGWFICAEAGHLPLPTGYFDLVFCRDLLHHVGDMEKVVAEMYRVCKPGGQVMVIEANGKSPLIYLQGTLIEAEAGVKGTSPARFQELLSDRRGREVAIFMAEPLPIFRVVLHYRFGFPQLAAKSWVGGLLDGLEKVAAKIIPARYWAYTVGIATKAKE